MHPKHQWLCIVDKNKAIVHKGRFSTLRFYSSTVTIDYSALKVVFFGTDSFSKPSLELLNKNIKPNGIIGQLNVVTSLKATKNPVQDYARQNYLNIMDFKCFKEQVQKRPKQYDLGLVVSFGHLIPKRIIEDFPLGILNVHASLLPKLRGAAPIIHAIKNGDTKTGITIMKIQPKRFDVGEIMMQKEIDIGCDELMPDVHNKMAHLGSELLLESIISLPTSLSLLNIQNEEEATYAPKIDDEFIRVRWNIMQAKQVYDLYRSLYSFKYPISFWNKELVKLKEIRLPKDKIQCCSQKPGTIRWIRSKRSLGVTCADGKEIEVLSIGIGKRNRISAQDFNNGFLKKVDDTHRNFE